MKRISLTLALLFATFMAMSQDYGWHGYVSVGINNYVHIEQGATFDRAGLDPVYGLAMVYVDSIDSFADMHLRFFADRIHYSDAHYLTGKKMPANYHLGVSINGAKTLFGSVTLIAGGALYWNTYLGGVGIDVGGRMMYEKMGKFKPFVEAVHHPSIKKRNKLDRGFLQVPYNDKNGYLLKVGVLFKLK